MSLLDFATDLEAEEVGRWVPVNKMKFLVAKAGNKKWKVLMKRLENQAYGSMKRNKDKRDTTEQDVKHMLECLARTCILDWKEVRLEEGSPEIKYSEKKSVEIMMDEKYKLLSSHLLEQALDESRYMEEEIADDEADIKK